MEKDDTVLYSWKVVLGLPESVKTNLADIRVIVPNDPEVAILKGTVLVGNKLVETAVEIHASVKKNM